MRSPRSILLLASVLVVVLLLGGGLALQVGASENSYRQAVLFAEVLSLVTENYVDPVEQRDLLLGAYEGMLGGLDPNGAFLTPEEVVEWKRGPATEIADPGFAVLKLGSTVQVIAVAEGSPAQAAGVLVGDHVRSVDGRLVRDLSLEQARRMLRGEAGSRVTVEVLHPEDGFEREEIELARRPRQGRSYDLQVRKGTAVLTVTALDRLSPQELDGELDDIRSRGVDRLLLDLRNLAEGDPRNVARVAGLFAEGPLLHLRDRSGRLVEAVEQEGERARWSGRVAVLVNGATAGAGEALAALIRGGARGEVYGESTYGLGAEANLFELDHGYGLLVSSAMWETVDGSSWNDSGIEPDEVVRGDGDGIAEVRENQLEQVLTILESEGPEDEQVRSEAA